jgi:hypothetical protein
LLHGTPPTILDRGAPLDDAGDRGGPTLGRLPKGVSNERARCLRGVPVPVVRTARWLRTFGRSGLKARSNRIWAPAIEDPDQQGSANPALRSAILPSVIREIEIWRVAVVMINRYADEAGANSFRRAEELRPRASLGALRRS